MAANPISVPSNTKYLSANVTANRASPFLAGEPALINSLSGTTVYGVNHPGSSSVTKYAKFVALSGQKGFILPTSLNAPQNTTGGAVSAANQLRVVGLLAGVPKLRARGDQVAPASGFVIGAGGGTAVADATLSVKGTTAADLLVGSTKISVASSGSDTQTILVGDTLTVAGDSTVYIATATSTALNGTTEVEVNVTPPLQKAQTAGLAITVATPANFSIIFGDAVVAGQVIEALVLDAADVITITGGALTAGRDYDIPVYDYMHTAGNASLDRVMPH